MSALKIFIGFLSPMTNMVNDTFRGREPLIKRACHSLSHSVSQSLTHTLADCSHQVEVPQVMQVMQVRLVTLVLKVI